MPSIKLIILQASSYLLLGVIFAIPIAIIWWLLKYAKIRRRVPEQLKEIVLKEKEGLKGGNLENGLYKRMEEKRFIPEGEIRRGNAGNLSGESDGGYSEETSGDSNTETEYREGDSRNRQRITGNRTREYEIGNYRFGEDTRIKTPSSSGKRISLSGFSNQRNNDKRINGNKPTDEIPKRKSKRNWHQFN